MHISYSVQQENNRAVTSVFSEIKNFTDSIQDTQTQYFDRGNLTDH